MMQKSGQGLLICVTQMVPTLGETISGITCSSGACEVTSYQNMSEGVIPEQETIMDDHLF